MLHSSPRRFSTGVPVSAKRTRLFTPHTALRSSAPDAQPATTSIHDITGARIRTLAERVVGGVGVVTWDGRSSTGARAPAGVYYARIESTAGTGACRLVKLN